MSGHTTLITGASQGLGRALAIELAAHGGTLLLHGRNDARLQTVAEEARAAGPDVTVRTYLADLSDLDQVHALADRIRDAEPHLDGLINNAAVTAGSDPRRREVSRQGYELRLAVNLFAPYALTLGLLPLLSSSAPARVINVASSVQGAVDFRDVMMEHNYDGLRAYGRSKLALIMATFDLAVELQGTGVTVNAVHPADLMDTESVRAFGIPPRTTPEDGAQPVARLLLDPEIALTSGRYFDRFTDARAHAQAYDPAARRRLMELTRAASGSGQRG
ncbi:SDR family NAD(P)-dependent oxidoreductase [Streptomyces sp. NPDC048290]|uniref:SDR family NAD(P)-dependent oxidoreductase n=1 Tax=Streptomyces sp. NPDC048290 TaxID=3155811 RepID=UPI003419331F